MSTCGICEAVDGESAHFEELVGLGEDVDGLPVDGFPAMPEDQTSCVVSFSSVIGGIETWVIRLDGDPWYR